jgi:hypothetical protein
VCVRFGSRNLHAYHTVAPYFLPDWILSIVQQLKSSFRYFSYYFCLRHVGRGLIPRLLVYFRRSRLVSHDEAWLRGLDGYPSMTLFDFHQSYDHRGIGCFPVEVPFYFISLARLGRLVLFGRGRLGSLLILAYSDTNGLRHSRFDYVHAFP